VSVIPSISSANVDPQDIGPGVSQFTVNVQVSDNTGVQYVVARAVSMETGLELALSSLSLISGNPQNGIWQGTLYVTDTARSKDGTWRVDFKALNTSGGTIDTRNSSEYSPIFVYLHRNPSTRHTESGQPVPQSAKNEVTISLYLPLTIRVGVPNILTSQEKTSISVMPSTSQNVGGQAPVVTSKDSASFKYSPPPLTDDEIPG
jgi:ADP-ribose pyrophosphatase YjhB (NUDIX family)